VGATTAIRAYLRNQEKEDEEVGAIEPLALIMSPSGGSKFKGSRQRHLLPLRTVHILKPPALSGDTYHALQRRPQCSRLNKIRAVCR
jgi:hypothetical protein